MKGKGIVWTLTALCSLLGAAWSGDAPSGEFYAEDSVKAAFVLRFAAYVQWPEEEVHGDHFTIAVLGASNGCRTCRHWPMADRR